MLEVLAVAMLVVAVPVLSLALVVKLDTADERTGVVAGPLGWPWLDAWLARIRPWHAAAALVLTILIFATFLSHSEGIPLLFAAVLVLGLFVRAWRQEFVALMSCTDETFPGRNDKLAWAVLMVVLPPVGFSCFRAYRRAHRIPAAAAAKPSPIPELF